MLAKPGEESGLYKRQRIHVKTGIVTGTGGVLKKGPPGGHAVLHGLCVPDLLQWPSNMHAHLCLDWSCRRPLVLLLHVNKCMLYQPKNLADFQQQVG